MKPNFVRHLGLMLLGASAARVLSFANLLLAARLYSKDDFGGLALALGFVGLVQPFLTLRYEIAVVLARTDQAARSLVYGALGIALCIYAVVSLVVVAAPGLLAGLIPPDAIVGLRAPVLLQLAATIVIVSLTAWLQKHKAFGTIAASQFVGALGTAVLVLGAPFVVEATLTALVWGYAGGALLSALILAAVTPRSRLFRRVQSGRIWPLLAKYRVYPTYSLPLTISSLTSDRALLLYLSGAFSLGTLGGFYSVRQLLFGLVHLVTSSINQVVFPYVSQTAKGVAGAKRPLLAMTRAIAMTTGLGLGWLCLHATPVTLMLLGDRWLDVAQLMPWIAAHAAAVSLVGWQGRLLDVERRQRLDAMLQMAGDVAALVGLGFLWLATASVTTVVATISIIGIAHAALWLVTAYRVTRLGTSQAIACMALLGASAIAAASLAALCKLALGPLVGMTVSLAIIAVGMAAAILGMVKYINQHAGWRTIPAAPLLRERLCPSKARPRAGRGSSPWARLSVSGAALKVGNGRACERAGLERRHPGGVIPKGVLTVWRSPPRTGPAQEVLAMESRIASSSDPPLSVGLVRKVRRAGGIVFDRAVWFFDRIFDYRNGTDTSGTIKLKDLRIGSKDVDHGRQYEPSPPNLFKQGMASLSIDHADFIFVDFGAGKGRTLLMASSFPFAEVIGVEFSEELHRIAQRTLAIHKSRRIRCAHRRSVCANATEYELPDANLVIYLANPFDGVVLAKVLRNIEKVAARRKVYLIYCEAIFSSLVDASGALPYKKPIKLPRLIMRRPRAFSSLIVYSNQKL